jgi:hypothetical protein
VVVSSYLRNKLKALRSLELLLQASTVFLILTFGGFMKRRLNIVIENCEDCPWFSYGESYPGNPKPHCNNPDAKEEDFNLDDIDWTYDVHYNCPLPMEE